MGLKFQPKVGSVVVCDFRGMVVPEIVKKRPVIVVARNRFNSQLVTVVPISTTVPVPARGYHHALRQNPIPGNEHISCWVKCDMINVVSLERLDRIKEAGWGRNKYIIPTIERDEFELIKLAIIHGLGMSYLVL